MLPTGPRVDVGFWYALSLDRVARRHGKRDQAPKQI